jgi:hypothetical protein
MHPHRLGAEEGLQRCFIDTTILFPVEKAGMNPTVRDHLEVRRCFPRRDGPEAVMQVVVIHRIRARRFF